jgi:hypothetical protein
MSEAVIVGVEVDWICVLKKRWKKLLNIFDCLQKREVLCMRIPWVRLCQREQDTLISTRDVFC